MPDMGLDGLFRQEQMLADLTVDEPVCDKLKHFDLSGGGILADLSG